MHPVYPLLPWLHIYPSVTPCGSGGYMGAYMGAYPPRRCGISPKFTIRTLTSNMHALHALSESWLRNLLKIVFLASQRYIII